MTIAFIEPVERLSALASVPVSLTKHKDPIMFDQSGYRKRSKQHQSWNYENFRGFIRSAFPQSAEYHVASVSGIPAVTVGKHLRGETRPGADHMMAYIAAFGVRFLAAVMPEPPDCICEAAHAERLRDLHRQCEDIKLQINELSG